MVRLPPEHELEVEGVELGDEEEEDDAEDGQPTLEGGQRLPLEFNPAVRAVEREKRGLQSVVNGRLVVTIPELCHDSLDLAPVRGDVPKPAPVISLDGQVPAM